MKKEGLVIAIMIALAAIATLAKWIFPEKLAVSPPAPSITLSVAETDNLGYVLMKQDQMIGIPVRPLDTNPDQLLLKDIFLVVDFLGEENGLPKMTNFEERDYWLLLQSFAKEEPRFLLFHWQPPVISDRYSGLLKEAAEKREELLGKYKSLGLFLHFTYEFRDPPYPESYYLINPGEWSLKVNSQDPKTDNFFAKTFNSQANGRLLITLDETRNRKYAQYFCAGCVANFIALEKFSARPEVDEKLPMPVELIYQSFLDYQNKALADYGKQKAAKPAP